MVEFDEVWRACLDDLQRAGRWRQLRDVTRLSGGAIAVAGRAPVLDFSSNDYLGLSHHPELIARAGDFARLYGAGSGASRLVTGNLAAFAGVEAKLAAGLRARLSAAGLDTGRSETQIVPVILGAEARTLAVAAALEAEGFLAVAIRPPTVPAGTSRLRITLSAAHREADVELLADAVIRLSKAP